MNYRFSLFNKVRSKDNLLSRLNPIEWSITLQTMPSLNSPSNYCCKRIQPRVNSDPSFLDVPKYRLLAYLQGFD
jgi:hypothetical protein